MRSIYLCEHCLQFIFNYNLTLYIISYLTKYKGRVKRPLRSFYA